MILRDLFIEAIERAEAVGTCEHNRALVLIDPANPRNRIEYTLTEVRAQVALTDKLDKAAMN